MSEVIPLTAEQLMDSGLGQPHQPTLGQLIDEMPMRVQLDVARIARHTLRQCVESYDVVLDGLKGIGESATMSAAARARTQTAERRDNLGKWLCDHTPATPPASEGGGDG